VVLYLDILALTRISCALCCLIYAAENLASGRKSHDLMNWEVLQLRHPLFVKLSFLKFICSERSIIRVNWVLLISSILLLFNLHPYFNCLLYFLSTLCLLAFAAKSSYGMDGSDQVMLLLNIVLLAIYIKDDAITRLISFSFISLQLLFSYFISGYGKLSASVWRNGEALTGIMGNTIYGNDMMYSLFRTSRPLAVVMSWTVFLWETLFFISIFCPSAIFVAVLLAGVAFHFTNAIVMGLNTFMIAFLACYFPLLYFYQAVQKACFRGFDGISAFGLALELH
jgi:hypothetical protein